jgi:hypothetical protein
MGLFSGCSGLPVVKFGMVHGIDVIPTRHIQYRPNTRFGYQLNFDRDVGVIKIREEFFLPGPSRWDPRSSSDKTLTQNNVVRQSRDGTLRIEEFELAGYGEGGWYRSSFTLHPPYPQGAYRIRVWLNGRPPKEFNFQVE